MFKIAKKDEMHRSIFVGPVDRPSSSMVCDAQLLGQRFENVAVDHGHLVQKEDRHAKQSHNFLVPLREIKLRFVVCAQIKQAVQSGSPNLGAQTCDFRNNTKTVAFPPPCFRFRCLLQRCRSVLPRGI